MIKVDCMGEGVLNCQEMMTKYVNGSQTTLRPCCKVGEKDLVIAEFLLW